jgi:hypothetical protein
MAPRKDKGDEVWRTRDREAIREKKLGDQRQQQREDMLIRAMSEAIQAADDSWFNEDYLTQARAAIAAVRETGWDIVPEEPSEAVIQLTVENMPYGAHLNIVTYLDKMWDMMISYMRQTWRNDSAKSDSVPFPTDDLKKGDF